MQNTTPMGVPVIGEDGHRYLLPTAQMPLPRRAYRVRELVFMLGLAKSTIHDMIGRGELKAVKIENSMSTPLYRGSSGVIF